MVADCAVSPDGTGTGTTVTAFSTVKVSRPRQCSTTTEKPNTPGSA